MKKIVFEVEQIFNCDIYQVSEVFNEGEKRTILITTIVGGILTELDVRRAIIEGFNKVGIRTVKITKIKEEDYDG